MAQLVPIDDPIIQVQPANGRTFTLDELRDFVRDHDDGWIEIVKYGPLLHPNYRRYLIVNEMGALAINSRDALPVNPRASIIAGQEIRGQALVCSPLELGESPDNN